MKIILLCGGDGQRLWPFSHALCPKPFLKLLPPLKPGAAPDSMLMRIWQQLDNAHLTAHTFIATSKDYVPLIHEQLSPLIPLIVEPCCKDTYPAILLATLYCLDYQQTTPDETLVVLPVDTYTEQDFFLQLPYLETLLNMSGSDLALIGITPSYPSEKYGYILPLSQHGVPYTKVKQFVEKPPLPKAKKLLEQGALWNSGVFAFKASFITKHLKKHALPLTYQDSLSHYQTLTATSFDYALAEKTPNKIVTGYHGKWDDLGTWDTLSQVLTQPITGCGALSDDCENVHILNGLSIPIQVLGVSNIVVAATSQGILVTDKTQSHRLKNLTLPKG